MHQEAQKYVVDVMTAGPLIIGPETNAGAAEYLATVRGVHHLLVMDGYRLVGIVCPCDLYAANAQARVSECMHTRPLTVDDQETAATAWEIMKDRGVGCLPVVDWTGSLRGVVTRRDLRRAGVVEERFIRRCAACGSTHGLMDDEGGVAFCVRCLDQNKQPRSDLDEDFFTVGGGD